MGYKAGMEIPMLEIYYNKLVKDGIVERIDRSIDQWYVAPKPSEYYEEE